MLTTNRVLAISLLAVALSACESSTAPTMKSGVRKTECVTRDPSEDCDRSIPAPNFAGGWQLAYVNGHAVSPYHTDQAYSFHATPSDPYNTRFLPVGGYACANASGAFIVTRQVGAYVDTFTVPPLLPAASPYAGNQFAIGVSTYLGDDTWALSDTASVTNNAWQLHQTMTVTRSGDWMTMSFPLEGGASYTFVNAGQTGVENCALSGY